MTYEWGRPPEAGKWQWALPVWFLSVTLLALASGIGVWWIRQTFVWTPLQQSYRGPDADGPRATVAHHGVRRVHCWAPDRDSEGRAVVAIAPSRPSLEGTGARVRPPVQQQDARKRGSHSPRYRACRRSCSAFSQRWRFHARSSRAICSSWATLERVSPR